MTSMYEVGVLCTDKIVTSIQYIESIRCISVTIEGEPAKTIPCP